MQVSALAVLELTYNALCETLAIDCPVCRGRSSWQCLNISMSLDHHKRNFVFVVPKERAFKLPCLKSHSMVDPLLVKMPNGLLPVSKRFTTSSASMDAEDVILA